MRFASSGIAQIHRELEEAAEVSVRGRRPELPAHPAAAAGAGPAGGLDLPVRAGGARTRRFDLPGRSGQPRARNHQPHNVEEGGSYGAVAALDVLQIMLLIVIVAGLRWIELRIQRRAQVQ
jgi:hypothetical protein